MSAFSRGGQMPYPSSKQLDDIYREWKKANIIILSRKTCNYEEGDIMLVGDSPCYMDLPIGMKVSKKIMSKDDTIIQRGKHFVIMID